MLRRLTILSFFCLLNTILFAQQPIFNNIENKQLPSKEIRSLMVVHKSNLLLSTDKGVFLYKNKQVYPVLTVEKHSIKDIISFVEIRDNSIWMYSFSGKIYKYQDGHLVYFPMLNGMENELSNRIINTMYPATDSIIYFSTVVGGSLYLYDKNNVSNLYKNDSIIQKYSFYVQALPKGGFVWGSNNIFPPNNKLLFRSSKGKNLSISLSVNSGYSKTIFYILGNDNFLFSKGHEIINFSAQKILSRTFVEKSIQCIFKDHEGKLWIGLYNGGILCYPDGNISSQIKVNYLGNKTVTAIDEDAAGKLWVATMQNGIFFLPAFPKVNYTNNIHLSANIKNAKIKGLESPYSSQILTDTQLLKKNLKYLSVTSAIENDTTAPTILINNIRINSADTALKQKYRLAYNQNMIRISFVGFENNKPVRLQYRYKMSEVEKDWTYTENTNVQYNSLQPGHYTFQVFAMNNNGTWSKKPAQIIFNILPPFWLTWWFITSIIFIILIIIILSIYFSIKQTKKKEHKKAEETKRVLTAELQALRAQMNPHFMFNTLASIQNFIASKDSDQAVAYLSKFSRLMRNILENSQKPLISLKDEIATLELYMYLEALRLDNKFTFEINIDKNIDASFEQVPSMLIQPYVENAIWHGISHKPENGKIIISINKEENHLLCTVVDDGIGRTASGKINETKKKHKSQGMNITKERLEILNAMQGEKLSVKIIDLADENNNACGTKVEIYIPLS